MIQKAGKPKAGTVHPSIKKFDWNIVTGNTGKCICARPKAMSYGRMISCNGCGKLISSF